MRSLRRLALLAAAVLPAACATAPAGPRATAPVARGEAVLGRSQHVLVARLGPGDTPASLARRYLGDESLAWRVSGIGTRTPGPGEAAAIALRPEEASPVAPARHVPILCYHRFTPGASHGRMEVSAAALEAQLKWLKSDGWNVISLAALAEFVDGRGSLPPKSIAITVDDGYRSAYEVAAPIFKTYGVPATFFVYPDFIGAGEAMSWAQLDELQKTKLFAVQPHSKSHTDMAKRRPGETQKSYADRVRLELEGSSGTLSQHLKADQEVFAYPFGATNAQVLESARRAGYKMAVTVARGGNTAWSPPLLLRRDMIFGDDSVETFARRVRAAAGGQTGGTEAEG